MKTTAQMRHERRARRREIKRARKFGPYEFVDIDTGATRRAEPSDAMMALRSADGIIRTYSRDGTFVRAETVRRA